MCLPIIAGIASAASGIAGAVGAHQDAQAQADYQNESATRNYKYQLAKREGEWNKTLSVWGNKKVDYQNEYDANYEAAGRSWSAEQYRLNEQFQQAAFQKQDMLAQLIQGQGGLAASGKTGKSAAKLDQAMVSAFGRNNAIIAANLASARTAMVQRNEDYRQQLQSANNRAWSNVAIAPTPDVAPPQPVMVGGPSGLGLAAGILGGVASGLGVFNSLKAPSAGNFDALPSTKWGEGDNTQWFKPGTNIPNVNPKPTDFDFNPSSKLNGAGVNWGGSGYNNVNYKDWFRG